MHQDAHFSRMVVWIMRTGLGFYSLSVPERARILVPRRGL